MAFRFGDPVDQYRTGDLTELWTQAYDISGESGTPQMPTVDPTGGRRGGPCLLFSSNVGPTRTLSKTLAISGNTAFYGFAFKQSGNFGNLRTIPLGGNSVWPGGGFISLDVPINCLAHLRNNYYTQAALSLNNNGTLSVIKGDAAAVTGFSGIDSPIASNVLGTTNKALLSEQWYFIEIELTTHASSGTLRVYVNDVLWLEITGVATIAANGGAVGLTEICLGQLRTSGASTVAWRFHDIRLIDTDTSDTDNDLAALQGDLGLTAIPVTADGDMRDFTPLNGGDHYVEVDEIPPDDDGTYNASQTANHIDSFRHGGVPFANATIVSAGVMYSARRVNAGPSKTQCGFRIGGTNYRIGTEIGNTSTYSYDQAFVNKKPSDHTAWSNADFAAAQPLYEKTA